jgi:lysophospholipase L1-like esterase
VLFAAVLFCMALLPTPAEVQDQSQYNVAFMGSSSIARWNTLREDFPDPDMRPLKWGVGATGLSDATEILPIVIPYKPRVIVLYAGENNLDSGKTPKAVYEDFKVFVAKVHAALPDTRIVYISIKPSPLRWRIKDSIVSANAMIRSECAKDGRLRFADVYSRMLSEAGEPDPDLFVDDKLHMNDAGYRIWKDVVTPLLN